MMWGALAVAFALFVWLCLFLDSDEGWEDEAGWHAGREDGE